MTGGRVDVWKVGVVALVLGAAILAAADTLADPDLWGHVRFGGLMLEQGRVVVADPYSYLSAGHPWINHEWLAEIVFALAYEGGGPAGLVALKALVALAIAGAAYWHLSRRGLDPLRAGILVMLLVALVRIGIATVRPHLFTYALFFLVLLLLEHAGRRRPLALWALPPLFALWVNLHGGFLAGLGIVGVWTAALAASAVLGRARDRVGRASSAPVEPRAVWWAAAALVTSVAATLVNPYGAALPAFLFETATVARPEITEWRALRIGSIPGLWYLLFVGALGIALLRSVRAKRPETLAVLAVATLVPLLAVRHLPLFALAGVVLGADHFASAFGRAAGERAADPGGGGVARGLTAWVVLAAGVGLGLTALPRFGCIEMERGYYPVRAVRALGESGVRGNLAVLFNWGEYAIWHLAPRIRVSMDGRRETVYPDSIYAEHLDFIRGTGDWDGVLEKRPTDAALVETRSPASNLLDLKPGWTLLHRDSTASLFGRAGWAGLERVRAVSLGDSRSATRSCFP